MNDNYNKTKDDIQQNQINRLVEDESTVKKLIIGVGVVIISASILGMVSLYFELAKMQQSFKDHEDFAQYHINAINNNRIDINTIVKELNRIDKNQQVYGYRLNDIDDKLDEILQLLKKR
jgi:hypothetical protein